MRGDKLDDPMVIPHSSTLNLFYLFFKVAKDDMY
jgi:hypothetical protein